MRDMGLRGIGPHDGRRLEVVATGLPIYRGVPLALDASVVAPLHADGSPWPHAAETDGVALARAEAAKRRAYPELLHSPVVRLVTVAAETGGRLNEAALDLLRQLAAARARTAPPLMRQSAQAVWLARWQGLVSVAVQDALAATLVDDGVVLLDGADGGPPPDADVWMARP